MPWTQREMWDRAQQEQATRQHRAASASAGQNVQARKAREQAGQAARAEYNKLRVLEAERALAKLIFEHPEIGTLAARVPFTKDRSALKEIEPVLYKAAEQVARARAQLDEKWKEPTLGVEGSPVVERVLQEFMEKYSPRTTGRVVLDASGPESALEAMSAPVGKITKAASAAKKSGFVKGVLDRLAQSKTGKKTLAKVEKALAETLDEGQKAHKAAKSAGKTAVKTAGKKAAGATKGAAKGVDAATDTGKAASAATPPSTPPGGSGEVLEEAAEKTPGLVQRTAKKVFGGKRAAITAPLGALGLWSLGYGLGARPREFIREKEPGKALNALLPGDPLPPTLGVTPYELSEDTPEGKRFYDLHRRAGTKPEDLKWQESQIKSQRQVMRDYIPPLWEQVKERELAQEGEAAAQDLLKNRMAAKAAEDQWMKREAGEMSATNELFNWEQERRAAQRQRNLEYLKSMVAPYAACQEAKRQRMMDIQSR